MSQRSLLILVLGLLACGPHDGSNGGVDAFSAGDDGGLPASADAEESCHAPDMLVVLDRTQSMSRRPDGTKPPDTAIGHTQSKWYIAIAAIESLTTQFQSSVRFGLALFPHDPGGGKCVTLAQKLQGTAATNTTCEGGEVAVVPALSAAGMVGAAIDPETTLLCNSTPIGAGLGTAETALAAIQEPIRSQYVVFVGDGNDTCDDTIVLTKTQALAAAGVSTYVIAFDGSGTGVDNGLLNDMACAGRTATGFPTPCVADSNGNYTATNRTGPPLYFAADDAAALTAAFTGIAGQVCCGCIL